MRRIKVILAALLIIIISENGLTQGRFDEIKVKAEIPYNDIIEGDIEAFFGIYHAESSKFIFIINIKKTGWVWVEWNPVTRTVSNKTILSDIYGKLSAKDIGGSYSISPNSRYVIVDRIFKTGLLVHDLENQTGIEEKGKSIANPLAVGTSGISFIDNQFFYQLESEESKRIPVGGGNYTFGTSNNILVKKQISDLSSIQESFDLGPMTVEIPGKGGNPIPSTFLVGLIYSPISPYGFPILITKNHDVIFIINEKTKKIINKFKLDNQFSSYNLSPFGKHLIVSSVEYQGRTDHKSYYQIFDIETGEKVYNQKAPSWKDTNIMLSEITEEFYSFSDQDQMIKIQSLPEVIQNEINYKNWLKVCEAKRDSIAEMAKNVSPAYQMNSPENDWIYISGDGSNGMANGIGNAIRKDGMRFIENGLFIDGEFVAGKMENVYEVSMEGEFKDMKLNGFGRHITENKALFEGTFVNGKLEGEGEMIEPSGLTYVGGFKNGLYEGKGTIVTADGDKYEGGFLSGKPHGEGIQVVDGRPEEVKFYEGERIDQVYLMRVEREKIERERLLMQQEEQRQQQVQAQLQKKKTSNRMLGALVMGVGAGIFGSSAGMDAMQSMEFGTAMFQDVMKGGTNNLDQFQNKMASQFAQQRAASEGAQSEVYKQKAQTPPCNYKGPSPDEDPQGAGFCFYANQFKCAGNEARLKQMCEQFKSVSGQDCPACN